MLQAAVGPSNRSLPRAMLKTTNDLLGPTLTTSDMDSFACSSCAIAFSSSEEQRIHYRSELHQYNMKRRVAGLPPITLATFKQNSASLTAGPSTRSSSAEYSCEICRKSYMTENSYRSHLKSRKHRNAKLHAEPRSFLPSLASAIRTTRASSITSPLPVVFSSRPPLQTVEDWSHNNDTLNISTVSTTEDPTPSSECLFCPVESPSIEASLIHMHNFHSFFVPDSENLVDVTGLLAYLRGKVSDENICIYCLREFRTSEAAQRHMIDKAHCRIRFDDPQGCLELADYYRPRRQPQPTMRVSSRNDQQSTACSPSESLNRHGGCSLCDGSMAPLVLGSPGDECPMGITRFDDVIPVNAISYGETPFELVLRTGTRIGHRSLKRYFAQSLSRLPRQQTNTASGAELVRLLRADKHSNLVPVKGSLGAFGAGTEVVKARNRGEARNAGSHIREFREQHRMDNLKTRVGFHNNYIQYWGYPFLE